MTLCTCVFFCFKPRAYLWQIDDLFGELPFFLVSFEMLGFIMTQAILLILK
jgi:F0F1-type ATP synthase assembly protein I